MSEAKPPEGLVRQLERRMGQQPCVGSLSRWSRHYRFGAGGGTPDQRIVFITYKQVGATDPEGIFIDPPPLSYYPGSGEVRVMIDVDDRPMNFAWATYDRRSHTFELKFCGFDKGG